MWRQCRIPLNPISSDRNPWSTGKKNRGEKCFLLAADSRLLKVGQVSQLYQRPGYHRSGISEALPSHMFLFTSFTFPLRKMKATSGGPIKWRVGLYTCVFSLFKANGLKFRSVKINTWTTIINLIKMCVYNNFTVHPLLYTTSTNVVIYTRCGEVFISIVIVIN